MLKCTLVCLFTYTFSLSLVVGYYIKVVYCDIVIIIYGKFLATSFTGFVIFCCLIGIIKVLSSLQL